MQYLKEVLDRFWNKVDKRPDGCWFYCGYLDRDGYGQFLVRVATKKRKKVLVHRLSYELANGTIPTGGVICHRCNNPPCINPDHLFLDTNAGNQVHRFRQGRIRVPFRDWSKLIKRRYVYNPTDEERFWSRVQKTDTCWIWTGAVGQGIGYGMFRLNNRAMGAHRASWIIHHGEIHNGMFVLHRCDNRLCIRPEHLFLGTQFDNMADCRAKGRAYKACGEQVPKAKLKEHQVLEIRRLFPSLSQAAIAVQFGIDASQVSRIVNRKFWTHI